MIELLVIVSLIVAPVTLTAYVISRYLVMRAARHRANISHPEYHAHDNWHDHEEETLSDD